ncbi:MAG: hypothetical protein EA349_03385 [Halomonadaceae bacterium]|nr:MAG: hypothetical protein EA349_03385 [Halomonadaceae bacterium]
MHFGKTTGHLSIILALVSLGSPAVAGEGSGQTQQHSQSLGTVSFQADCTDTAQGHFDQGLALMHHMMYEQARGAFEQVLQADPECAMGHWGVATSLFQPLWDTRPETSQLERGWHHSEQAMELAEAPRERALIEATSAFFYNPTGDLGYHNRLGTWADAMAAAFQTAPEDEDVAALYALSRMTLAQQAETAERHALLDEAEMVLRRVHLELPRHPGAIHYSIHATDADGRAENALDKVTVYGEIAPEVPHALHMPSHIYVRLGDWPQVIEWNQRSASAAAQDMVNGQVSAHYIHAMDYLLYAFLQQGEDEQAREVWQVSRENSPHQASFISAFHLAAMPARLSVEQRQWREARALTPQVPDHQPWEEARWAEAITWFARGLGALHGDNMAGAEAAEERLHQLREMARDDGDEHFATYIDTDRRILSAWRAYFNDDPQQAINTMRSAVELEQSIEKHPVTPGAIMPPSEALGDLLLAQDQAADALQAYQNANRIWPGRYHTLLGAARAAHAAGETDTAREYYQQLLDQAGESQRPEIAEAADYVGA